MNLNKPIVQASHHRRAFAKNAGELRRFRKMFRKSLLTSIAVIIAVCAGVIAASAQGAQVRGEVKLTKADGSVVPAAGVLVEVFQTDANKGSLPSATTNKRGEFTFVQFPFGKTYALSVSGPGISPMIEPGVKAGRENIVISVKEGDGKKLTEAEVRQALTTALPAAGSQMTEEEKKAAAEQEAKVAEVTAKNKKIEEENALITKALQEGNAAFTAKNFDEAVARYNEGISAAPDYAGSAPVLLNNRGAALRERAVIKYNQVAKSTDATAKVEGYKAVKSDLGEAADGYHRSWTLVKAATAAEIPDAKVKETQLVTALSGAKDAFRLMAATEQVDETKLDIAKTMLPEYLTVETDAAKKESAKIILADLYRVAGDATNAIAEYRKVLETSPDNLDAMAGLGLSLVNAGYINDDKAQLQEGANVLAKFAAAAPDTHKYKNDAVGLIENLKSEQKIAPQKTGPAKRKN